MYTRFPPENYSGTFIGQQNCPDRPPENPECPPEPSCDQPPFPPACQDDRRPEKPCEPPEKRGILGSLFGKNSSLEIDDILLLGLIFLLANGRGDDCENSDDLLLILGLLFFMGFGK